MATIQNVIAVLKKAGKETLKFEKGLGKVRDGYSVSKWNKGLVGVLVNSNDLEEIAEFKAVLKTAGFKVWRPINAAIDGLFVSGSL